MSYLQLVIHCRQGQPLYLEIGDIPPGLRDALKIAKVSHVELLMYDKTVVGSIAVPGKPDIILPSQPPRGQLDKLKEL